MEASDDEDENEDGWVIPPTKEKEEGDDNKRFFILDHSYLKEYQRKIYDLTTNKVYASKTLVYLEKDGTLSPRGIMLIDAVGEDEYVKRFYYPAEDGVNGALWRIAKAFVAVNDSGHHQLVSHWLYTHAAIEPFVIATNRQLSVMHPIYKLLSPHYRDTMNMNSLARQLLIHANGPVERNFFPGKFAMSLTSEIYKSWNLMDHALPTDLCKRGVAAMENNKTLRLLISDYPYAVDGLEIYCAIQNYVSSYSSLYYTTDISLQCDVELQTWWTELRELGHGDLKHETWWPNMQTLSSLTEVCTILIWLASAYHASLNFGQYAYAGFVPNRPTFIRHPMPDPKEYDEIENDPEGLLLKSITSKAQALTVMSVLEILSMHSSDEVYIGQREDKEWTSDRRAVEVFERFREELVRIEKRIEERNKDERLQNRIGEVGVAYTLLYPSTSDFRRVAGISGRGVPNSVSV
ncbi:linoleate 9S-lipoxygenase 5, chloroplastic-like [Asparagus officinalis]|uniref:linoleate 9S-lipoxygenase 5, chloroplastic-like n=1 Tax=Asparagus officinalis TaxID=4686 RepID=UPI00098DECDE|nr:linoleate 9S-lipoxygenase 5, chloroplastic-like [Asparagus officinalis]